MSSIHGMRITSTLKSNPPKTFLQIVVVMLAVLFTTVFAFLFKSKTYLAKASSGQANSSATAQSLPKFTPEELKKYNGTDPKLPIYLALDGNVYDVTKGKEFYIIGGPYHYLAGKDSSFELHIVGGDIIKRKYSIIGKYESAN